MLSISQRLREDAAMVQGVIVAQNMRSAATEIEQFELAKRLAQKLRWAFDTTLINELDRHGGIPHLSTEQMNLRDAIAALLEVFPE